MIIFEALCLLVQHRAMRVSSLDPLNVTHKGIQLLAERNGK
jgi:hypothetical protein